MLKKRWLAGLLALGLLLGALSGCGKTDADAPKDTDSAAVSGTEGTPGTSEEAVTLRVGGLKGPTSMGLVKLMADNEAGTSENKYDFTVAGSADELTPRLAQGTLDIAAVPANLAAVLYNNPNVDVQLLAINTLGVLYLVEKGDSVQSVADVRGKTIYATGKGSTPEYALRYILTENGIDPDRDVTIEWKTEPTEVVAILSGAESAVAMLPQPYVAVAQGAVPGLRVAADLTAEWDALENGSTLLTGTLVVRKKFAQAHPEAIAAFLREYAASTAYVNENAADAALLVEKYGIVKAAVAEKAIPYCHIVCITGTEMQPLMSGYLTVLLGQNPAAIGGKLPDGAFCYVAP